VRGHVLVTLLLCALATAYRLACEREDRGGEPVGWPRGRRQLREQTRHQGSVLAQGEDGIFPLAEDSRRRGARSKMGRQVAAPLRKSSPSLGSPCAANRFVGISG
jgi:hypothetical protein